MLYSDLAKKQTNQKYDPVLANQFRGRVRVMAFRVDVTAADTQCIAGYLPAGNVRVLGGQSSIGGELTEVNTALSIGLGSYTDLNTKNRIPANETVLQTAKAMVNCDFDNSKGNGVTYSSDTEVPVIIKAAANLTVNDFITGSVLYVVD